MFGDCRDYRGIVRRRWPGEVKFVAQFARDTQNSQSQARLWAWRQAEDRPSQTRYKTLLASRLHVFHPTSIQTDLFKDRNSAHTPLEFCVARLSFLSAAVLQHDLHQQNYDSTNTQPTRKHLYPICEYTHTPPPPPICNEEIIFASFLATSYVRDAVSGVSVI